uniref:MARVEL domain-containing protein n=1 Tax=Ciona savignyi TaxID=51511 RepID=H2YNH5_CIOSA
MGCCPKLDFIVGPAILIYLATAITEIVSSVPVGLLQDDFKGSCVFSAQLDYVPAPNNSFVVLKFGAKSACQFCTYLTIFTVLFPLIYGSYSLYALYKSIENASQMWVLPAMMVNVLLFVLKFISSCILSVGFSELCNSVTKSKDIKTCSVGQSKTWLHGGLGKLTGSHYDTYLKTAQSASWFCVFEWFLLSILSFLHYRRNMKLRSSGEVMRDPSGFNSSDTAGVVSNEVLPGSTGVINPNYSGK